MTITQPVQHVASLPGLPDADRGGTLEGIVIIELTETLAGEFAGGLLTDLGATVIKIEPLAGSPLQVSGPAAGLTVIVYFLRYISTHSFRPFVIYRIALGLVVLGLLAAGVIDT